MRVLSSLTAHELEGQDTKMYNKDIVLLLHETNYTLLSFSRYSADGTITMTSPRMPVLFLMHQLENEEKRITPCSCRGLFLYAD